MPSVRSIRKASDKIMMIMKVITKKILPTCCLHDAHSIVYQ